MSVIPRQSAKGDLLDLRDPLEREVHLRRNARQPANNAHPAPLGLQAIAAPQNCPFALRKASYGLGKKRSQGCPLEKPFGVQCLLPNIGRYQHPEDPAVVRRA